MFDDANGFVRLEREQLGTNTFSLNGHFSGRSYEAGLIHTVQLYLNTVMSQSHTF